MDGQPENNTSHAYCWWRHKNLDIFNRQHCAQRKAPVI